VEKKKHSWLERIAIGSLSFLAGLGVGTKINDYFTENPNSLHGEIPKVYFLDMPNSIDDLALDYLVAKNVVLTVENSQGEAHHIGYGRFVLDGKPLTYEMAKDLKPGQEVQLLDPGNVNTFCILHQEGFIPGYYYKIVEEPSVTP
jgi:hypothetical protein